MVELTSNEKSVTDRWSAKFRLRVWVTLVPGLLVATEPVKECKDVNLPELVVWYS